MSATGFGTKRSSLEVLTNFALVVHSVVVVFIVCPARLADRLVGHLFSVLALFPLLQLPGFASFRLALGHSALLPGLAGALVERLAALLALLAWVLLLLLILSIAVLILLTILIFALLLLVIALLVLLAVTLVLTLLAIVVLAALLTVLLTVLRHSFGKLRLKDQVTS